MLEAAGSGLFSSPWKTQCRIQGTFGAGTPVWAPKKWAQKIKQYSTQKFPFYQTVNNLISFEIYQKQLVILNTFPWVTYSRTEEKYEKFMRNMQQLPKPWCTTVISFWTCDGWQIQFIRGLKLHINFYCFS